MCQKCVDAVKKYFPKLPKKHYGDLLMGATAFPVGDAKTIERQLKELVRRKATTLPAALAYAQRQLDQQMKNIATVDSRSE